MGEGVSRSVPGFSLNSARNASLHSWNTKSKCIPFKGQERETREKKNLGRGNKRQVRVKKGLRGQRKRPLPREKGPRGPCDPLLNTGKRKKYPERPCPNGRGRCLPLGPHSGEGQARWPGGMPRTMTGPPLLVRVKKSRKTQQKGKTKTRERSDQKHPCRLASRERASEEYQENPKNARGPEWHPDKNARRKGRTAKTGEQTNAAGDKDKNKKKNTRCVWGCAL